MTEKNFRIVIPARYRSTRFPGKPLALIAGIPMVIRVYQRGVATGASDVVVATDDERIATVCRDEGVPVCMTADSHETGTDRIAEVCEQMQWADSDIVVNVQGDEPLIPLSCVQQVAENLASHDDASMATLCTAVTSDEEYRDPNNVKVVFDRRGMAMYFSRAPIPFDRDLVNETPAAYRHLGLYAYRVEFLRRYTTMQACEYESLEKLEQLRALWNGERIHVDVATELPGMGVDTPEQLLEVQAMITANGESAS